MVWNFFFVHIFPKPIQIFKDGRLSENRKTARRSETNIYIHLQGLVLIFFNRRRLFKE